MARKSKWQSMTESLQSRLKSRNKSANKWKKAAQTTGNTVVVATGGAIAGLASGMGADLTKHNLPILQTGAGVAAVMVDGEGIIGTAGRGAVAYGVGRGAEMLGRKLSTYLEERMDDAGFDDDDEDEDGDGE